MRKFKSIFLIDDDEISNFLCCETIKGSKIAEEVVSFLNADEALNFILKCNEDELPEIIFLDINMPGMDGWEFLEDFKKTATVIKEKIKVIILSSSQYHLDIEKSKRFLEVSDYLPKPLTSETLLKLFHKYSSSLSKSTHS